MPVDLSTVSRAHLPESELASPLSPGTRYPTVSALVAGVGLVRA